MIATLNDIEIYLTLYGNIFLTFNWANIQVKFTPAAVLWVETHHATSNAPWLNFFDLPMGFCTAQRDVDQEKKSADQGGWLHICHCEQPERFVSHGAGCGCCEFRLFLPGAYAH